MKFVLIFVLFVYSFPSMAQNSCPVDDNLKDGTEEALGLTNDINLITEPDRCSLAIHYDPENPQVYEVMKVGLEQRGYNVTRYNPDEPRSNFTNVFPSIRCETQYSKCWIRLGVHFYNNPNNYYAESPENIDFPSLNLQYDFEIDPNLASEDHMQEAIESIAHKTKKKFLKCNHLQRIIRSARVAVSHVTSWDPQLTRQKQRKDMVCRITKSFRGFDRPVCQ